MISEIPVEKLVANRALWFHKMGFNIVPFLAVSDRTQAKATNVLWKNGRKNLQIERQTEQDVRELLASNDPNCNFTHGMLGINGISGLHSFDIDKADTTEALYILLDKLGLPRDYAWVTQSGSHRGYHVWLHNAEGDGALLETGFTARKDDPETALAKYDRPALNPAHFNHMELRWHASLTALPGSMHPSGNLYRFVNAVPTEKPATVSTERIKAAWDALVQPYAIKESGETTTAEDTGEIIRIEREKETPYGRAILKRVIEKLKSLSPGDNRYNMAYGQAWYLFEWANGGQLNHDHVTEEIYAACEANGAVSKHGETKIRDNIANALANAGTTMRVPPGKKAAEPETIDFETIQADIDDSQHIEEIDLCKFDADDSGNGDAMHALYGNMFLWCSSRGWFVYNGKHWQYDADGAEIKKKAVATLRLRRHAAVDQDKEAIIKCSKADERRVNGCVNRFKTLVGADISTFDNNPDLLNCKNGVLDLRSGTLQPHNHTQRFTYCLSVDYRKADYTNWQNFLQSSVGGGQEVIDYLQLLSGYSLTGHTREEILIYLYGETRAGKGTFAEVFMALLATPLYTGVDFNSFTAKREGDVSNFDLAPLRPCRMVVASESQKNQSLNPAKIKQLTGGDPIRACHKHQDFFTFKPQFKVWMLSNWTVNGDPEDNALWGRVRVIEFPNSFLGKEDKGLKARLTSDEALTGVLYWAVQGAIKWYALGIEGLKEPEAVRTTTQKHRDDLDFVQKWLDDCTVSAKDEFWTPNEIVTASYLSWCKDNNVQYPKGPKNLAQSLQSKGYKTGVQKKQHGKNKKGVQGFALLSDLDDPIDDEMVTGNVCNGRNHQTPFKENTFEKGRNETLQTLPVTETLPDEKSTPVTEENIPEEITHTGDETPIETPIFYDVLTPQYDVDNAVEVDLLDE